jgi:bacillithiol system protein YtxJ
MNWNALNSLDQLQTLLAESNHTIILIFKYSTRCSISRNVLGRLERNWNESDVPMLKPYFLDLIAHRELSNHIANQFDVVHKSPQVLIIRDGQCVNNWSHFDIDYQQIKSIAKN